ncbi:MAG: tetratricopeptide repeat protein [Deltaproteobacteria bacterium]
MHCPRFTTAIASLALALGVTASTTIAWSQSLESDPAWRLAADLERAGRHDEAARTLQPLATQYPDEYALALQLGWLWFRAEAWPAARRAYAHALALSGHTSVEARLGLAWTQLRMGRAARSRRQFERVIESDPASTSAREGLAIARDAEPHAVRAWVSAVANAQVYTNHPVLRAAYGIGTSARVLLGEHFLFGATYRYLGYDASAQSTASSAATSGTQHQVHATLGYVQPSFALRVHGAVLLDTQNTRLPAYTVGLSAWFAARGDVDLEAGATVFSDTYVLRTQASWNILLAHGVSLGPTASAQYLGDGTVGGSLGARLGFRQGRFAASLAGRVGDEARAVFLNDALAYPTTDRVRGAVSLAARVALGAGLSLTAGYEFQRLGVDATTSTTAQEADVHTFTAGLLGAW